MKDRILFWIDMNFVYFGIAKFLKNKYDYDAFVIFDTSQSLKKSLSSQKLVDFKKKWFFWDYVSKSKIQPIPDLDYLKSIEEKYAINLWTIAYNERLFLEFNLYHKFTKNEILSILEQECKFYEKVLDESKPDFLIIKTTDNHRNNLLYEICKAKGIQPLVLFPTRIGYRSAISCDCDKTDQVWHDVSELEYRDIDLDSYRKKYDTSKQINDIKSPTELSIIKQVQSGIRWISKSYGKDYQNYYTRYGVSPFNVIKNRLLLLLRRKIRKSFIDKNLYQKIYDEKIIYFPLQTQPERSISIDAPFHTNQIEVITNIAKSLPVNYVLYVKEHPMMNWWSWRKISDYKKIMALPNVKLIHPSVNPDEIYKKCDLVITITGTSGLDAAFYNKPSIVLENVMYSSLDCVNHVRSFEDLSKTISSSLNKKVYITDLKKFLQFNHKNSFQFNGWDVYDTMMKKFHDGLAYNTNISLNELNLFFEKNEHIFGLLADEHLKKINDYKNYNSKLN